MSDELDDWSMDPTEIPEESMRKVLGDMMELELLCDPFQRFPAPGVFAPVIGGTATEHEKNLAGEILVDVLQNATPERCKTILTGLQRMKETLDKGETRQALAYRAHLDLAEDLGRAPSKPELRQYIIDNPRRYACPSGQDWPGHGMPWTRVWEGAGLASLPDLPPP